MDRFLHFVLLFAVLPFAIQGVIEKGGCECAVFSAEATEPIMQRLIEYNVTCNSEGEERCQLLCVALAQGARDKAPQMICKKLNVHVEDLQVAVYSKICNAINWKFTGLRSTDLICCHEGELIPCSESSSIINDWMDSLTPLNP